jgi:hypothetical protein
MSRYLLGIITGVMLAILAATLIINTSPRQRPDRVCSFTVSDRNGVTHQFEGVY